MRELEQGTVVLYFLRCESVSVYLGRNMWLFQDGKIIHSVGRMERVISLKELFKVLE